ncbi:hypothetical protein [Methylorubrum zatmanii]|uniref:Uncharacterized protein n=1 Tax=Methylorubrum zatmanii TaxID=29429 RepID=A0ABW1WXC5_9HYPH|nr:hypothetical protein [Methylorubrum zatmanii]MBD8909654.1 hypothetical protein [Methylorubrum zatmanii]
MPLAVIHSRDDDGCAVVGVPISNRPGTHAWLYAADYAAILNDYGPTPWFVNDNGSGRLYVRLYVRLEGTDRPNNIMVSRLVLGDFDAPVIRYRDGDRLNLRSRNLDAVRPAPQRRVSERPNRAFRGLTSLSA